MVGRVKRREFLVQAGKVLLTLAAAAPTNTSAALAKEDVNERRPANGMHHEQSKSAGNPNLITLFLCGDVMTGRGIDQVLPYPNAPRLFEPYVKSALDYVVLAEQAHGRFPKPVEFAYIWGDALSEFERVAPDVRVINLETAVTRSSDHWRGKDIHYRMHPDNLPCLTAAGIDCCVLANNHVLDWGYAGLDETLATLKRVNIKTAGAGHNPEEAEAPAVIEVGGRGRVLVFAFGTETSGILDGWAATRNAPGVSLLSDLSETTVGALAEHVRGVKRQHDIVVASVHWGPNWGYAVPEEQRVFAHRLIDEAEVDVVHGHSSHHPKGIEVYRDRLILYGCGDLLNDYEGIGGYEEFRSELSLMYFPGLDPVTGKLVRFEMTPTRIERFRVNRAAMEEAVWLSGLLNREGRRFGTRVRLCEDGRLRWEQ